MIKVVNMYKHKKTSNDIYVGRGSALENPYTYIIGKSTEVRFVCSSREEAIKRYESYLTNAMTENKDLTYLPLLRLVADIVDKALDGDVFLVCYCKPCSCHGDVIKKVIDKLVNKSRGVE